MNITFKTAEVQQRAEIIELWKSVFADLPEYANICFDNLFVPENTMLALCGQEIVAMLMAIPAEICNNKSKYNARYIWSVATKAEFRSKGISKRLMEFTHCQLKERGVDLSFLVPAENSLFEFYTQQGYETSFFLKKLEYEAKLVESCSLNTAKLGDFKSVRDSFFSGSEMFVKWDKAMLDFMELENSYCSGATIIVKNGYAVCAPVDESVVIKEWVGDNPTPEMLDLIAAYFRKPKVVVRLWAENATNVEATPYAMAYWYKSEREKSQGQAPYFSLVLD